MITMIRIHVCVAQLKVVTEADAIKTIGTCAADTLATEDSKYTLQHIHRDVYSKNYSDLHGKTDSLNSKRFDLLEYGNPSVKERQSFRKARNFRESLATVHH